MPKTQSALLEAMAERQVTVDGVTRPVPQPFLLLATENPIEYEGTFPLPEAQLDRFFLRTSLGYPTAEEELSVIDDQRVEHPLESLGTIVGLDGDRAPPARRDGGVRRPADRSLDRRSRSRHAGRRRHVGRRVGARKPRARARRAGLGARSRARLRRADGRRAAVPARARRTASSSHRRCSPKHDRPGWRQRSLPFSRTARGSPRRRRSSSTTRPTGGDVVTSRGLDVSARFATPARGARIRCDARCAARHRLRRRRIAPVPPGDNPDRIDWGASARLSSARSSDEFVVREYFADEAPRAIVAVDRGSTMGLCPPGIPWLRKDEAARVVARAGRGQRRRGERVRRSARVRRASGRRRLAAAVRGAKRRSARRPCAARPEHVAASRGGRRRTRVPRLSPPRRAGRELRLRRLGLPRRPAARDLGTGDRSRLGHRARRPPGSRLGAELPGHRRDRDAARRRARSDADRSAAAWRVRHRGAPGTRNVTRSFCGNALARRRAGRRLVGRDVSNLRRVHLLVVRANGVPEQALVRRAAVIVVAAIVAALIVGLGLGQLWLARDGGKSVAAPQELVSVVDVARLRPFTPSAIPSRARVDVVVDTREVDLGSVAPAAELRSVRAGRTPAGGTRAVRRRSAGCGSTTSSFASRKAAMPPRHEESATSSPGGSAISSRIGPATRSRRSTGRCSRSRAASPNADVEEIRWRADDDIRRPSRIACPPLERAALVLLVVAFACAGGASARTSAVVAEAQRRGRSRGRRRDTRSPLEQAFDVAFRRCRRRRLAGAPARARASGARARCAQGRPDMAGRGARARVGARAASTSPSRSQASQRRAGIPG